MHLIEIIAGTSWAAYDAVRSGKGVAPKCAKTPNDAIANGYGQGLSDEFILPTVIGEYDGMKDGDGLLMCNFRVDRAREILTALAAPEDLAPEDLGRGTDERDGKVDFADVAGL